MKPDQHTPADRFIDSQSWWIASELIRRHSAMWLWQSYDPVFGSALHIGGDPACAYTITFSRVEGISVLGPVLYRPMKWDEVLAQNSPYATVKMLERSAVMTPPYQSPSSTAALVYRVMASLLTAMVNDRHAWYVMNVQPDTFGLSDQTTEGAFEHFPLAHDQVINEFALAAATGKDFTLAKYWALFCDVEPVALFHADGSVYLGERVVNLPGLHVRCGKELTATAAKVLNRIYE